MHLHCLALLFSFASLPLLGAELPSTAEALSGALRTSGLPTAAESVTLPFTATVFGTYTVEVNINGNPVQLVLDTGASSTALSPDAARKLGLQTMEGNKIVTSASGGQVVTRIALTQRISLGDAWTENEPVLVTEMIPGIEGVLGVGTLADWDVRIDPATKKLTLFPAGQAPQIEGETVLPLTCQLVNAQTGKFNRQGYHTMNLSVPVRVGTHELLATPDTGHGTIFQLPSALAERVAPQAMKEAQPALATSITLSGKTVSRKTKLPEFTFGPDTLRSLPTDVIDATPGSANEREGLIGLKLLRHYVMTLRFAAGELRLKPLGTVEEITRPSSSAGFSLDTEFKILSLTPEGPADKAGLRAGDEMLEIEGIPFKTMTPEQFAAFRRLPAGSVVKVRYRRGELSPVETSLVLEEK